MGPFNPSYFLHTTNILLLVAYSVRDILWLRLFAVAASLIALPYFHTAAGTAVGTNHLEWRLCCDQFVPVSASFCRATSS